MSREFQVRSFVLFFLLWLLYIVVCVVITINHITARCSNLTAFSLKGIDLEGVRQPGRLIEEKLAKPELLLARQHRRRRILDSGNRTPSIRPRSNFLQQTFRAKFIETSLFDHQ